MIKSPFFPFKFNNNMGFENYQSDKDVIRFHLTNLFLTNPGEKISDANYGVGVRRYLFENLTEGLVNNLEDEITDQVKLYLPYIKIIDMNIIPEPEDNKLAVSLKYEIIDEAVQDAITLVISGTDDSQPTYWGTTKNAKKTFNKIY